MLLASERNWSLYFFTPTTIQLLPFCGEQQMHTVRFDLEDMLDAAILGLIGQPCYTHNPTYFRNLRGPSKGKILGPDVETRPCEAMSDLGTPCLLTPCIRPASAQQS